MLFASLPVIEELLMVGADPRLVTQANRLNAPLFPSSNSIYPDGE